MDCSVAKAGLVISFFLTWGMYYNSCNSQPAVHTQDQKKVCFSGFHSGGCEEFYHLGYNDVYL
jgi:hypothetical protein